ncbi:homoserine kinase [Agaribacter marinus]|uniref:Homoserine kinase n=1 Tax=Agaribacter marinus TaxID=1431249 RepID=A0AA37SWN8_9ALTE|nr:homoserine kinase [Agaribacter marinus]GLR71121.1 homoserine kinase [Agaribacter marinus]
MATTKAYAPASIGNVSLGFDILGAALAPIDGCLLGDWVSISDAEEFQLSVDGRFADRLPAGTENNIVTRCYNFFQDALAKEGKTKLSISMHLHKALPIGSGLGSSASSIVAAFYALNEHAGSPFDKDSLLLMMGELEGQISGSIHYDNVAPSYLGGMTLMTGQASPVALILPSFDDWYWVACYSGLSVSTAAARSILPQHFDMATCLTFGRQMGVFVDALYRGDKTLAASVMTDVIAEQHRKSLLPHFDEARDFANAQNGLAFGISGSGPTVFAVADDLASAQAIQTWLNDNYIQNEDGFSHVCKIDKAGTRVVSE